MISPVFFSFPFSVCLSVCLWLFLSSCSSNPLPLSFHCTLIMLITMTHDYTLDLFQHSRFYTIWEFPRMCTEIQELHINNKTIRTFLWQKYFICLLKIFFDQLNCIILLTKFDSRYHILLR